MTDLREKLQQAAHAPVLLVACDYDGTLAPIVDDPAQAAPNRESLVALRALAALPQTHVAVISGRALRDLAALSRLPADVHLVGSHGSEFDLDFIASLPPEQRRLKRRVRRALEDIMDEKPGFLLEEKPASIAFHYRKASPEHAQAALESIEKGPGALEGVRTRHGKEVVELLVVDTDKGRALEAVRQRVGASAAVFLGDDITDEDAFRTLAGPDVGVKVGPGESVAAFRIDDTQAVARLLAELSEQRAAWVGGESAVPIESHAFLSDQRAAALVTPSGRLAWLCAPRADAAPLFAEMLGGPAAGFFAVEPADGRAPISQEYVGDSLVVRTRWPGLAVEDFLDCSESRPQQRAGRSELVRLVEGRGRVRLTFAPRLDFGRTPTLLKRRDEGLEIEDTLDPIVLLSPGVAWEIVKEGPHEVAHADVDLGSEPLLLELRWGVGSLRGSVESARSRRDQTQEYWRAWVNKLALPSVAAALVRRSALTLKALCHGPSGAILAAATTSLPEAIGGTRNWDYRYCWLRDAALSAHALVRLGSVAEALRFLDWVLGVTDRAPSPDRLQPLYNVTGEPLQAEAEIQGLPGYRGSRPVRVGNAAAGQLQLDVFGPVVDLVATLMERDAPLSSEHWRLVHAMVQAVERRWREPDHGIWELRGDRRHHVHSKVACWMTVDRALRISRDFWGRDQEAWSRLRDEIAADVLEHGYHADIGAFVAAYDRSEADASALTVGLSGLVDVQDPRFLGTIALVERELRHGPTVYRYHYDDNLPGAEGGFHLCTSWLVQALARVGRVSDAWTLFHAAAALAGPTGLISEEYCPKSRLALGNHPQAYSHAGLIEAAVDLSEAAGRA